jgi:WD40 repeat protein
LTSAAFYMSDVAMPLEVIDWDLRSGQAIVQIDAPVSVCRCLDLAPGGRMLTAPRRDGSVWLWERNSTQERQLGEHRAPVHALAFSEDGLLLAVADEGDSIVVREVASRSKQVECRGYVEQVCALAFARDGRMLASGGVETAVRPWNAATGEPRAVLRQHTRPVQALAFSPDGRTLGSGDWDGFVVLWDVATRSARATLATAGRPIPAGRFFEEVAALRFAPDGQMLAVAIGPVVQLWDAATGTRVANLTGHLGKVMCLAFSPDGKRLASGSHDRTVRLWEVASYLAMRP